MEADLGSVIYSPQPISIKHLQCITYQILCALDYLHSKSIVHRDVKPMNILVNRNCFVKLADFGLSKLCLDAEQFKIPPMTNYVTTRWYRAPEVIGGWSTYSFGVDVWAVGTIMGELILRKPMFPGRDSTEQLEMLVGYCGKPSRRFIEKCGLAYCRLYLSTLPPPSPPCSRQHLHERHQLLHRKVHGDDIDWRNNDALDNVRDDPLYLLDKLLQMHPDNRLTAAEALTHPFFQHVQDILPHQEPAKISQAGVSTSSMSPSSSEDEHQNCRGHKEIDNSAINEDFNIQFGGFASQDPTTLEGMKMEGANKRKVGNSILQSDTSFELYVQGNTSDTPISLADCRKNDRHFNLDLGNELRRERRILLKKEKMRKEIIREGLCYIILTIR